MLNRTYKLERRIDDLEQEMKILEKKIEKIRVKEKCDKIQDAVSIIEKNITTNEEKMAWNVILTELGRDRYRLNKTGIR